MSGLRERMERLRGLSKSKETETQADPMAAVAEDNGQSAQHAAAEATETGPGTAAAGPEAAPLEPGWESIGVKRQVTESGEFLLRSVTYPLSHRHGQHHLGQLEETAGYLAAFHQGERIQAADILFLDLETTGLGVGAGNVPFMVGVAYMRPGCFVVEQALIRHPAEERAMLDYFKELFASFRYLATYNGRTFDWPVVQNRFIMHGYRSGVWQPLHLDFLHPSRSIWRNTLASCKLSYVEEERLGIARTDDVPGSLAPQIYFQFLADGDPKPLEGVFRHNEIDMLSLACLAIRFGCLLAGPELPILAQPQGMEELVRTGLWLERMGKTEPAELMFQAAVSCGETAVGPLLMLAARDKKAGNWQRAVVLWQKAITRSSRMNTGYDAYVELAMYHEHKTKNIELALHYTKEALELALSHPLSGKRDPKRRAELDALRKRLDRLYRKQGRTERGHSAEIGEEPAYFEGSV